MKIIKYNEIDLDIRLSPLAFRAVVGASLRYLTFYDYGMASMTILSILPKNF